MTDVIIAPRVEDVTSDVEAVVTGAYFRIRPAAVVDGAQWVHSVWPPAVTPINGAAVTVKLDALLTTPYELELTIPDGQGGEKLIHEFRFVPSSGTPVAWQACVLTDGPMGGAVPTGTVQAALDALDARIDGIVISGAGIPAAVDSVFTDATTFGRARLKDADAAAARTALGASTLAIGTTSTTAKAGDYQPAAANVSDSTATGRAVLTAASAAAARTAIGAGDSGLVIGTTSTTAKAGDYQPTAANISDSTTVGRAVLTAADAAAAQTAAGGTTVGKAVFVAADAAAARTAVGAGTSSLVIGTTTGTAADGGVVAAIGGVSAALDTDTDVVILTW